ncbi:MAG: hypothetical protein QOE90_1484 [Thermoplasmata archaeon]|jgi:hypothetical protein|nr:hypothetical protein [Thermoplasmata archaeon]
MRQAAWKAGVLVLLFLVATLPVGLADLRVPPTNEPRPVHAPIRFSDLAPTPPTGALNGVQGDGTEESPFIVEGWTFLVPGAEAVSYPTVGEDDLAPLLFDHSHAYVVVRHNTFLSESVPIDQLPPLALNITVPGVAVVSSSNVVVAENEFVGVGGTRGAVEVTDHRTGEYVNSFLGPIQPEASRDIFVRNNSFVGGPDAIVSVERSQANILGNTGTIYAYNTGSSLIHLHLPVGENHVENNTLDGGPTKAWVGFWLTTSSPADAPDASVIVANNTFTSTFRGIDTSTWSFWQGEIPVDIRDNRIAGHDECGRLSVPGETLERNEFSGCQYVLFYTDRSTQLGTTNTFEGKAIYQLQGLRDQVIEGEGVAWLDGVNLWNVTLRHMHVENIALNVNLDDVHGLSIEDSRFDVPLDVHGEDVSLDRVNVSTWASNTPFCVFDLCTTALALSLDGPVALRSVVVTGGNSGTQLVVHGSGPVSIRDSTFTGASLVGFDYDASGDPDCPDATFSNATFQLNAIGLQAAPGCGMLATPGSAFIQNSQWGLQAPDSLPHPVDARNAWWGNATGPTSSSNPRGTGDATTGDVQYDPWLTSQ